MKKSNLSAVVFLFLTANVFAGGVTENFLGLSYPSQQTSSGVDYSPPELNQLMSDQLKNLPQDAGDADAHIKEATEKKSVEQQKSAAKEEASKDSQQAPVASSSTTSNTTSNSDNSSSDEKKISDLRKQAIQDIATSLGASAGLSYRMGQIMVDVNKSAVRLDALFNFSNVIIDNGVLAPVLTEGLANYAKDSDDEVRIADKIYKIESPAKFV